MLGIMMLLATMTFGRTVRPSDGQPVRQSDGPTLTLTRVECGTCRIVKTVMAEFGNDPAAQEAAPDGLMGGIAVGNAFLGIVQSMKAVPVVFGADGKLIRVLGRSGQGPGEFAGPGLVSTWRGDSILIADGMSGRISVFDRTWTFGRSFPLSPTVESWAPLSNGLFVAPVSQHLRRNDMLQIIDATGKSLGTFGRISDADSVAGAMNGASLITTDGRSVWTVSFLGTYRIIEWNPVTKARSRTLVRRGDGFASKQEFAALSPKTPPSPAIKGLYRDGPHLWVFYSVADRQWARGLVQAEMQTHTGKAKYWKPEQPDLVFDTIVEAIDIATGKLLASQKFDEAYIAVTSTGNLALHRGETTEGEPLSRLVKFEVRR
jgi:hypothetical protein